ncbi:hypothetical protein LCGC14_2422080 [marine sediment metagenome]|uniref:Uncharacterized protein n=1 Tax=marine sediment metagenome TaxID=412755 RepID=A0A0F9E1J6_9ZZZZ
MGIIKKVKANRFINKRKKWDKLPFYKQMKELLTWHKPFEPNKEIDGLSYCPSCGDGAIKENGLGFFRCRNEKCRKKFIILLSDEKGF